MRGYIWVGLLAVLIGCNVSDTESEFEFTWERVGQFSRNEITAIHVSDNDELFVATGNRLFKSIERNSVYTSIQSPDSADIVKIRTFEDRILIIGEVYQSDIGNFGDDISFLYQSLDEGLSWELITSGFEMQDVTYLDNHVHIAKEFGVRTIDLLSGVTVTSRIVESRLTDYMDEIEVSSDGTLAVACHEGVFISTNNGDDWTEIATEINKDDDWIRAIEFNGNELFALESSKVYRINLITGDVETNKGFVGYEQLELTQTGELVKLGNSKLGIANQGNLSFDNIYPSNVSDERLNLKFVDSFADGTLAITAGEKLFLGTRVNAF